VVSFDRVLLGFLRGDRDSRFHRSV
jgi:hypothetical protein